MLLKRIIAALSVISLMFFNFPAFSLDKKSIYAYSNPVTYGDHGVLAYCHSKHGPDGRILLDPYLEPFFENMRDLTVLDAGCGAGPWSLRAAQKGAFVHGVDIQPQMIERAKQLLIEHNLEQKAFFELGDVLDLHFPDHYFDKAISINVICNLPLPRKSLSKHNALLTHFNELYRVLKTNGQVMVSGPASLGVVLTNGKRPTEAIIRDIKQSIIQANVQNDQGIIHTINQIKDVQRATFVARNEKLILIENEKDLMIGEKIWRKIPGLVVPNFYYPEEYYVKNLELAGFKIIKIKRPTLNNTAHRQAQVGDLGEEYKQHHPFVIINAYKA